MPRLAERNERISSQLRRFQPRVPGTGFGGRLRACGLGAQIVAHLEERAADSGAERIEIGVFAYNKRALRFFSSLGYEVFLRKAESAWWGERLWEELRLQKFL